MDLLLILRIIGMMLQTFFSVLLGITLAMSVGAAIYLTWQWWLEKSEFFGHEHHPKRA